jgi:limonene-1,2-epoxide hydrolase
MPPHLSDAKQTQATMVPNPLTEVDECAAQTVAAYVQAIASRDFERARTFLADSGFSYFSPLSRHADADQFIADVSRVWPILEGIDVRRTFVDGDEVCSILDYRIRLSSLQVVPVAQLARVSVGRIVSLETFFDASDYRRMVEVE